MKDRGCCDLSPKGRRRRQWWGCKDMETKHARMTNSASGTRPARRALAKASNITSHRRCPALDQHDIGGAIVQSGTHGRHNVPQVRHLNCLAQCLHCPEGLRVMSNIDFATHLCKTHPVLRKVPVISTGLVATLLVSRPRGSCRRPFIIIITSGGPRPR
jgi:hypothetical protein